MISQFTVAVHVTRWLYDTLASIAVLEILEAYAKVLTFAKDNAERLRAPRTSSTGLWEKQTFLILKMLHACNNLLPAPEMTLAEFKEVYWLLNGRKSPQDPHWGFHSAEYEETRRERSRDVWAIPPVTLVQVLPIAIMRDMFAFHKVKFDPRQRIVINGVEEDPWRKFAATYNDLILSAAFQLSPEESYQKWVEEGEDKHSPQTVSR